MRQLRDYLHQVCHSLGLPARLVPHQLRHTYATEMIRSGVGFPALMTLLGHTSADMTMRYVNVALTDLRREFDLARSQPRHLVPQPKTTGASLRAGLDGVRQSTTAMNKTTVPLANRTGVRLRSSQTRSKRHWGPGGFG